VKNGVLHSQRGKEYPTIKRKIDRIGHILRRDGLLKHVIQGMILKSDGNTWKETYVAAG
jgi:hypothetical protein